jgi:hypothetical protein
LFLRRVGSLGEGDDGKSQDAAGGQRGTRNVSWMDSDIHE